MAPPEKPKDAPFFLTTIAGLEPQFVAPTDGDEDEDGAAEPKSRILNMQDMVPETRLMRALRVAEVRAPGVGVSPVRCDFPQIRTNL